MYRMTAIPQAQNFNDLGSVVMSYVYAFSSIIGADFRQKFVGVLMYGKNF